MSTTTTTNSERFATLISLLVDLMASYDKLDISRKRYIQLFLAPAFAFFIVTIAITIVVDIPLVIRIPIPFLGLLVFASAVVYPKIYISQRKIAINNQFHLVMTHMTVLATTNVDRVEVFRRLAAEKEYGILAEEMGNVVLLVDTWNLSLDDACRRRAKEVPSDQLADFLERLGYTLAAGQDMADFLLNEQGYLMENYTTTYEGALRNIEVMKDLYMSMILSMTFALVFAIVLPILTGVDPNITVIGVMIMFMFVQLGFFFVIRTMSPYDPVWFFPEARFVENRRLWGSLAFGGIGSIGLVVFMGLGFVGIGPGIGLFFFFLDGVPLPMYVAIPTTPLLITGIVLRMEEGKIIKRDGQYPNFIRGLGAAETAKNSTTSNILETMRNQDFGDLNGDINRLYRRLEMRINPDHAWGEFTVECRSYLIQKFSEMYLVGRQLGGSPKRLGEIIGGNMNSINQLREQRKQTATTLIGLLYGITAAATFAFFIGLEVVAILASFATEMAATSRFDIGQILHPAAYDIPTIEYFLLLIILFNAALSSLMIRVIDGGNKATSYIHFVALTWLGCLTAIFTREVVSIVLQI